MKSPTKPGSLMSRKAVSKLLGVSRQMVHKLEDRDEFPPPLDVIDDERPVWPRDEVQRYAECRKDRNGSS